MTSTILSMGGIPRITINPHFQITTSMRTLMDHYYRVKIDKNESVEDDSYFCPMFGWGVYQMPEKKEERSYSSAVTTEQILSRGLRRCIYLGIYWNMDQVQESFDYDPMNEFVYMKSYVESCVSATSFRIRFMVSHFGERRADGSLVEPHFHVLLMNKTNGYEDLDIQMIVNDLKSSGAIIWGMENEIEKMISKNSVDNKRIMV